MEITQLHLPDLDNIVSLPESQIQEFREKGHTIIRGLLSPEEIDAYHAEVYAAALKYNTEKRKMEDRDTYGKAFLQIMNLWRRNENVKKIVMSKRLAKVAADLLGVKNVRVYHDQALFKEPGGGPTPWHQDQYYWPIDTHNTLTMWMPFVDIDEDMGMLTFASGSQKKGSVFNYEISDESEQEFDKYVRDNKFEISRAQTMKAGDATWHYGFTIHNAPGNESDKMREVFTIIYLADDAKIIQPKNSWQQNDLKSWLMDKEIGTCADSELNPLVL
jgi:ectoine hydroxylase-related dioxygenase (phytanoyl-CoA dioxygenase family)